VLSVIFRGALDVARPPSNEQMKLAAVRAIAELAQAEQSDIVAIAYGEQNLSFGPEYLIPKPFDPRLIVKIAPAVAKAAMESGVATRPIGISPPTTSSCPIRLLLRSHHETGIRRREEEPQPRGVLRGRGRTRAARRSSGGGRGRGQADPDRPARGT